MNRNCDVRWLSGRFLESLQSYWEEMGDDILRRVGESHPELILMSMVKIAAVRRIEIGQPGDFSGLKSKEAIRVPFVRHQAWVGLSAGVSELARRERCLL